MECADDPRPGGTGRAGEGGLKVTIGHDFVETYGGAERILAAISASYPQAPVWAILGRRRVAERMGVADRFHTILPERPALLRRYRALAPLFPAIVRSRRLPAADLLITSSYAYATGFRTADDAPQLCYCYSPLRFAWSMTEDYAGGIDPRVGRGLLRALAAWSRRVDRRSADAVTRFVAESDFVRDQIERFYGRESVVIRPPVDTGRFRPSSKAGHDGYYLFCGRLVEAYKRPSVAVRAFAGLDQRLVIAGDGPALAALRREAGPNIEFTGHLQDHDLIPLMQRCSALVFPSRDDFGLLPVEVMACGRPVLAYAGGGALETVVAGRTGEFFSGQDPASLRAAVEAFDPCAYDRSVLREHAEGFGLKRFEAAIRREAEAAARGEWL